MVHAPCCKHNNWDNVRVNKRVIVLRCRVCQRQWRTDVEHVWKVLRCRTYLGEGTCDAACTKMHINYKKQSLEARVNIHGPKVMDYVRVGCQEEVIQKVNRIKKLLEQKEGKGFDDAVPTASVYTHCPYSWGDVVPPQFV
eukprot:TRINITY_DN3287_c0_g1_i8.p1 TRINITY_DN3287_c0_g1~~TRINITY_DN3287_c0_g1_i8.p1  ORF type:complete len:140 (+),score=56.98 TRINITY_DN3287_c0_g1_i8:302-721(+)